MGLDLEGVSCYGVHLDLESETSVRKSRRIALRAFDSI